MKERFFIDSSFFFALVDKNNQAHRQTKTLLQEISSQCITSNYIFAETLSLITKRLGKNIGITFARSLKSSHYIELITINDKQEKKALEMYEKYKDKDFDFIDATSFVLCRELAIQKVLSFDHHFAQMGFELKTIGL